MRSIIYFILASSERKLRINSGMNIVIYTESFKTVVLKLVKANLVTTRSGHKLNASESATFSE